MGKCSIPRSNPGGGAERVGDIKVTTRPSLGDKWVLCNGDPKDGSESKIPDIKDEQCWTNVNGPPAHTISGMSAEPDFNRAVYAKDGIWYTLTESGADTIDIYKYDQNTGLLTCPYVCWIDGGMFSDIRFSHLCYNKYHNTLAICYTHDSPYSDIDVDNSDLCIYTIFIDCDSFSKIGEASISFETIADLCGADTPQGEVVWNKTIKLIHNGDSVVFFVSFQSAFVNESGDWEGDVKSYTAFLTAEYDDISQGHPVWAATPIDDGDYSSIYCNNLKDYIEIGDSVYALIDVHCPEWNYYSLAKYNTSTRAYTDLSNELNIVYGNDGYNPQINGARLATDGTNLYMLANNDIVCIDADDSVSITSGVINAGYNNPDEGGEDAKQFFYYNGALYVYCKGICIFDLATQTSVDSIGAFTQYAFYIMTSSNEIAKSNCIFTFLTNGTDNCYWFNGNDTVERWPIITVDEEAYCFMKIKE